MFTKRSGYNDKIVVKTTMKSSCKPCKIGIVVENKLF